MTDDSQPQSATDYTIGLIEKMTPVERKRLETALAVMPPESRQCGKWFSVGGTDWCCVRMANHEGRHSPLHEAEVQTFGEMERRLAECPYTACTCGGHE